MSTLKLLTWNIGNPSVERAQRQLEWLGLRPEHVFMLTETKASAGCQLLTDSFKAAGYDVVRVAIEPGELGTMIVSKAALQPDLWASTLPFLPARAASALLATSVGSIHLVGLYVPSRDASPEKTARKRQFLSSFQTALEGIQGKHDLTVLAGDLNILDPDHRPRYPFFAAFEYDFYRSLTGRCGLVDAFTHLHPGAQEYSWVGRTGDGYRYDYAFCSAGLRDALLSCDYVHEPRTLRLSDHSGVTWELAVEPAVLRRVTDPTKALQPPTLF